jgi:phage baseplate assembly protein W
MTAIQNYEPRILVLGIKIDSFVESYGLAITIAYKIKTSNIDGTTTIYLKRA